MGGTFAEPTFDSMRPTTQTYLFLPNLLRRDWLLNPINPIGKVYLFRRQGLDWVEVQVIEGPVNPGLPLNIFGRGMWFDGDRLIIASPFYSLIPYPSGAVFIYSRNKFGEFHLKQVIAGKPNTVALGRGIYEMDDVLYMGALYVYPNSPWWLKEKGSPVDMGGVVKAFQLTDPWLGDPKWEYDFSIMSANQPDLTLETWKNWFVNIIYNGAGSPAAEAPFDTFGLDFSGENGYLLVGGPEQRQAFVINVRGF